MKILKIIILQILIGICALHMKESINLKFAIFTFAMLEIWYAYIMYQIRKFDSLRTKVSNNGSYGAKMFCIVLSAILLVYVLELHKNKVILGVIICLAAIILFGLRKEISSLLKSNRLNEKTLLMIYASVLLIDGIYGVITVILPQVHYLHEYTLNAKEKAIIILICVAIAAISLPPDSLVARISTQAYKSNPYYKNDKNNEI